MGIPDRQVYRKVMQGKKVWQLINLSNVVTNRIIQLKRQGMSSNHKTLKNLRTKRSLILNVLTDKLIMEREAGRREEIDYNDKMEDLIELTL